MYYELLGFCAEGDAEKLVAEGADRPGRPHPVQHRRRARRPRPPRWADRARHGARVRCCSCAARPTAARSRARASRSRTSSAAAASAPSTCWKRSPRPEEDTTRWPPATSCATPGREIQGQLWPATRNAPDRAVPRGQARTRLLRLGAADRVRDDLVAPGARRARPVDDHHRHARRARPPRGAARPPRRRPQRRAVAATSWSRCSCRSASTRACPRPSPRCAPPPTSSAPPTDRAFPFWRSSERAHEQVRDVTPEGAVRVGGPAELDVALALGDGDEVAPVVVAEAGRRSRRRAPAAPPRPRASARRARGRGRR